MKRLAFVLTVLSLVGGGVYVYSVRTAAPEPVVVTQPFSRGDIVDTVVATGTLEAVETVAVGTQVSGVVSALYADFNSIVKKGQVIARLDPQLIQTQIDQQAANVSRAEADLERLRITLADARQKQARAVQLAGKGLIPRTESESADLNVRLAEAQMRAAEASLAQARAQLNNSRVNLRYTTISAPIDGIVISRNVDQGQTVAASMNAPTLYVIAADLTRMQVIASIDEADVGRMRPGQAVSFRVDAFPNDTFRGTVTQVRLQPAVVQNVVTYATVIAVPNPALRLKPGMTASVTVEIARRTNVVRVPNAATRFRPTVEHFAVLNQAVGDGVRRPSPTSPRLPSEETDGSSETSAAAAGTSVRAAGSGAPAGAAGGDGATTIDSLFGPLEVASRRAVAWQYVGNQLKPLPLWLGVTDGMYTEVLNEADLPSEANLVTSMASGLEGRTSGQVRPASPLMGAQPAGMRTSGGTGTRRPG